MYKEPWSDINEYPEKHRAALEAELKAELCEEHILANQDFSVLAKREDQDDVLVYSGESFYIVHLTWSGRVEEMPYPKTERYGFRQDLGVRLAQDAEDW